MSDETLVKCDGCKKDIPKHLSLSGSNGFCRVVSCKACGEYYNENGCFPGEACSKCDEKDVPLNVVGHCGPCVQAKFR